jgi:hypothetical protein
MLPQERRLGINNCRIPDDSIQLSTWQQVFARDVLREVVYSLKKRKEEEDGTSSA